MAKKTPKLTPVCVTTDDGRELVDLICSGMSEVPAQFPRSVRICGELWTVAYCSDLYHVAKSGSKTKRLRKLYGICVAVERLIVIETQAPRFEMIDTLYHEMAHAYMRKQRLPKNHPFIKFEEDLVEFFAKSMSDMLANNWLPSET